VSFILFLGPPGSGKGTQAARFETALGYQILATGDLLRAEIKNNTQIGQNAKSIIEKGQLVSDEIMLLIIKNAMVPMLDKNSNILLDGYPRTIGQAKSLDNMLKIIRQPLFKIFYFDVLLEEVVRRIARRTICSKCGASYHDQFCQPINKGLCDKCEGKLIRRPDDSAENATIRFKVYMDQTAPLLDYYSDKVVHVDATQSPELINAQINKGLVT